MDDTKEVIQNNKDEYKALDTTTSSRLFGNYTYVGFSMTANIVTSVLRALSAVHVIPFYDWNRKFEIQDVQTVISLIQLAVFAPAIVLDVLSQLLLFFGHDYRLMSRKHEGKPSNIVKYLGLLGQGLVTLFWTGVLVYIIHDSWTHVCTTNCECCLTPGACSFLNNTNTSVWSSCDYTPNEYPLAVSVYEFQHPNDVQTFPLNGSGTDCQVYSAEACESAKPGPSEFVVVVSIILHAIANIVFTISGWGVYPIIILEYLVYDVWAAQGRSTKILQTFVDREKAAEKIANTFVGKIQVFMNSVEYNSVYYLCRLILYNAISITVIVDALEVNTLSQFVQVAPWITIIVADILSEIVVFFNMDKQLLKEQSLKYDWVQTTAQIVLILVILGWIGVILQVVIYSLSYCPQTCDCTLAPTLYQYDYFPTSTCYSEGAACYSVFENTSIFTALYSNCTSNLTCPFLLNAEESIPCTPSLANLDIPPPVCSGISPYSLCLQTRFNQSVGFCEERETGQCITTATGNILFNSVSGRYSFTNNLEFPSWMCTVTTEADCVAGLPTFSDYFLLFVALLSVVEFTVRLFAHRNIRVVTLPLDVQMRALWKKGSLLKIIQIVNQNYVPQESDLAIFAQYK